MLTPRSYPLFFRSFNIVLVVLRQFWYQSKHRSVEASPQERTRKYHPQKKEKKRKKKKKPTRSTPTASKPINHQPPKPTRSTPTAPKPNSHQPPNPLSRRPPSCLVPPLPSLLSRHHSCQPLAPQAHRRATFFQFRDSALFH